MNDCLATFCIDKHISALKWINIFTSYLWDLTAF